MSDIMIHSKIMVVDDVLLRVGSANLNNRSFGLDTECDLAFEAKTPDQRQAIVRLRDCMLGHFCGANAQEVAASLSRTGSLITTARSVRSDGHSLEPIDLDGAKQESLSALALVADPERPIAPPPVLQSLLGKRPSAQAVRRFAKVICIGIAIALLILAWRFTALSALVHPDSLRQGLQDVAELPGAPLIVVAVFVVGGLVAFPVLLLIAATAAAFGPLARLYIGRRRGNRQCSCNLWRRCRCRPPAHGRFLGSAGSSGASQHRSSQHTCSGLGAARPNRAVHARQSRGGC